MPATSSSRMPRLSRRVRRFLLAGLAAVLALALLVVFFPWDMLRGPVNRYMTEKTGRRFEITRHLGVRLGRETRIVLEGIEFANPEWARDPYLVKADAAEFTVRLWPLLRGRLELPYVHLRHPQIGLQIEPDGRRTWALSRNTGDATSVPQVDRLEVDDGRLHYLAAGEGADIAVEFGYAGAPAEGRVDQLPVQYQAKGTWKGAPFTAHGRTGNVLKLAGGQDRPFPLQIDAQAGRTALQAHGTVAALRTLDGIDADVRMQGQDLADLYQYLGVALPSTPPYALRGHLKKSGTTWDVEGLDGKVGNSDLAGGLRFDKGKSRPRLSGELRSRTLDFADLAPIVGLPAPQARASQRQTAAGTVPKTAPARTRGVAPRAPGKVLPTTRLDFDRLHAMDADVRLHLQHIVHVQGLPLESAQTRVLLQNGVLDLDPLDLGIAGGRMAGSLRIDSHSQPAAVRTRLQARALQLQKLVPAVQRAKGSFGNVSARVDLDLRGQSVAELLAHANGDVGLLLGRGQFSNLLLEFIGLDGGEILKFFLRGDRDVLLRCGAAAFGVKEGLMTSKALVFDTTDTIVNGEGTINLATEQIDITLRPQPKDHSILSLRSPLLIKGTFAHPSPRPQVSALAGRAVLAAALAAINPLLALAATIETGPGHDADCAALMAQTPAPRPATKK